MSCFSLIQLNEHIESLCVKYVWVCVGGRGGPPLPTLKDHGK